MSKFPLMRGSIQQFIPALILLTGVLSSPLPVGAAISGGDDFNDNTKNLAKWGAADIVGNGVLTESNQRLQYTCSSASPGGTDVAYWPWILNQATYHTDWEVVLDVHDAATLTVLDQVSSIGLEVFDASNLGNGVYLELYASRVDDPTLRRGFYSALVWNDIESHFGDSSDLGTTDGAVRLAFNSQSKVLTAYYDANGATGGYTWTTLASFGINGAGGATGNASWGMTGAQPFAVAIYGFSSSLTISGGQMYADNFAAVTAPPPVLTNRVSGASLVLTWPQSASNYVLLQSPTLNTTAWTTNSQTPVLFNGTYTLSVPMTGAARFFRLKF